MKERRPEKISWLVNFLCKRFAYKEFGWVEDDEVFFRWKLFNCPWFSICLHRLDAVNWHIECHDHPWDFIVVILKNGYWEKVDPKQRVGGRGQYCGGNVYWRPAGSVFYRPAETKHNVITQVNKPSWSLVFMRAKHREWGFKHCEA